MLREVSDQVRDLHWLPALQNSFNTNLWGQALYPLLGLLNTFRKPFQDLRNTRHHCARGVAKQYKLCSFVTHFRLPRGHIQKALTSQ